MKISDIITELERIAPLGLQEDYDNSGLIVGAPSDSVSKALICLDSTEEVVDEAIATGCDLIIAHHPIVFKGLKRFNGGNYVERAVMKAIRNHIAIYACHTNLDNVLHHGVNAEIAGKLGLTDLKVLQPAQNNLLKLVVFVPLAHQKAVLDAMFAAGAGKVGNYSECAFSIQGTGTFKAGLGANPHVGEMHQRHAEEEYRCEVLAPKHKLKAILEAMVAHHPYEEVAYDITQLENKTSDVGSGIMGNLPEPMDTKTFLEHLKTSMELPLIRFTHTNKLAVSKVAICGGSGSFLIGDARSAGADVYVTADVKYHEFFDGENQLMICDIGHYESEKYTIQLFGKILSLKFPNFATIFANTLTNPVNYYK